jgi:hypothetical protein
VAGAAAALVKKSYAYTNNHFASKSVVNAVMLKAQLGQPIDGEYPGILIEHYPEIQGLVSVKKPSVARAQPLLRLESDPAGDIRGIPVPVATRGPHPRHHRRPCVRSGRPVIAWTQRVGRTLVVHNYGHGGCGVTLSWGTAERAADLAMQLSHAGGGIGRGRVGLATARVLQERGLAVTGVSRATCHRTPRPTWRAPLWSPVTLVDEAEGTAGLRRGTGARRAGGTSPLRGAGGRRYGVHHLPSTFSERPAEPPVSWEWAATPELFRPETLGPGQHPFPSPHAHQYRLMMIDPAIYSKRCSTMYGPPVGRSSSARSRPSPGFRRSARTWWSTARVLRGACDLWGRHALADTRAS